MMMMKAGTVVAMVRVEETAAIHKETILSNTHYYTEARTHTHTHTHTHLLDQVF